MREGRRALWCWSARAGGRGATRGVGTLTAMVAAAHLLSPREAQAYIDLGTGSYVFQVAVASLLGAVFALKAYWARIRGFFSKRPDRRDGV